MFHTCSFNTTCNCSTYGQVVNWPISIWDLACWLITLPLLQFARNLQSTVALAMSMFTYIIHKSICPTHTPCFLVCWLSSYDVYVMWLLGGRGRPALSRHYSVVVKRRSRSWACVGHLIIWTPKKESTLVIMSDYSDPISDGEKVSSQLSCSCLCTFGIAKWKGYGLRLEMPARGCYYLFRYFPGFRWWWGMVKGSSECLKYSASELHKQFKELVRFTGYWGNKDAALWNISSLECISLYISLYGPLNLITKWLPLWFGCKSVLLHLPMYISNISTLHYLLCSICLTSTSLQKLCLCRKAWSPPIFLPSCLAWYYLFAFLSFFSLLVVG